MYQKTDDNFAIFVIKKTISSLHSNYSKMCSKIQFLIKSICRLAVDDENELHSFVKNIGHFDGCYVVLLSAIRSGLDFCLVNGSIFVVGVELSFALDIQSVCPSHAKRLCVKD